VCTSYAVPEPLRTYDNQIPFLHLASYILVNVRDDINPELIGWNLIIKRHLRSAHRNSKFIVFVDSEKDSLELYNSRKVSLFGDQFVPNNVKLCYSSDKDKDSLQGQMIKMCHNVANSIYNGANKCDVINSTFNNSSDFLEGYLFVSGGRGGISYVLALRLANHSKHSLRWEVQCPLFVLSSITTITPFLLSLENADQFPY